MKSLGELQPFRFKRKLLPGESLPSYLTRLAEANFCEPRLFASVCNERQKLFGAKGKLDHPMSKDDFDALASLTRLTPSEIYKATLHRFASVFNPPPGQERQVVQLSDGPEVEIFQRGNNPITNFLSREGEPRYCPQCIQEAAYHRLEWSLTLLYACPIHHCFLVEKCPHCQGDISIADITRGKCRQCDGDIARQTPLYVPTDPFATSAHDTLRSWLGLPASPLPASAWGLPVQPRRVLFWVMIGLVSHMMRSPNNPFILVHPAIPLNLVKPIDCRHKRSCSPLWFYPLVTAAFKAMRRWPQGFLEFLTSFSNRHPNSSLSYAHATGGMDAFYWSWVDRKWNHPEYEFIQEAFDEYLLTMDKFPSRFLESSSRCAKRPRLSSRLEYVSLERAAELLKTDTETAWELVERGEIGLYRNGIGGARWLAQKDVAAIRARWKIEGAKFPQGPLLQALSPLAASKEAGQIARAIANGVADREKQLPECVYRQPNGKLCEAGDLDRPPLGGVLVDILDFRGALEHLSIVGIAPLDLVKKITGYKIRAFRYTSDENDPGILVFLRDDLDTLCCELAGELGWLNAQAVRHRLGVSLAAVADLTRAGFFRPVSDGAEGKFYERRQVDDFSANYIFKAEAAALLRMKPFQLYQLVKKGELQAVSGPGVDMARRYLFSRAEVEHLADRPGLDAGIDASHQLDRFPDNNYDILESGEVIMK
ncbi:MAG: TniQ family protein [Anaerolineales bacterium]|nr:TniQ family protein [Anaerolineales bacterium]